MKSFAELTEAIAGVDRDLAVLQCMRAELSLQLADEEQVVLKLATIREKLEGWADGKDVGVNDEADLIDMIRPMIEEVGVNADTRDPDHPGFTFLHQFASCNWGVYGQYWTPTGLLFDMGANPNATDADSASPLELVMTGDEIYENIMEDLLDGGADPDMPWANGATPLTFAVQEGYYDASRLLLAKGANPNKGRADTGATPLALATELKWAADGYATPQVLVKMLLDAGATLDLPGCNGVTALHAAAGAGHPDVARFLLDKGAHPDYRVADSGSTPLMEAVRNCGVCVMGGLDTGDTLKLIQLLLDRGADPNKGTWGFRATMLQIATIQQGDDSAVMQLLLDYGAEPEATFGENVSAAAVAAERGKLLRLQLLAAHGADVCTPSVMENARSATSNRQAVVDWLEVIAGWQQQPHQPRLQLRVAVALRLHPKIRLDMHRGELDPSLWSRPAWQVLLDTARGEGAWDGAPAVSDAILTLLRHARSPWEPARHAVYHRGFRSAIRTIMLVSRRLSQRQTLRPVPFRDPGQRLEALPHMTWRTICGFLLRCDFPVGNPR